MVATEHKCKHKNKQRGLGEGGRDGWESEMKPLPSPSLLYFLDYPGIQICNLLFGWRGRKRTGRVNTSILNDYIFSQVHKEICNRFSVLLTLSFPQELSGLMKSPLIFFNVNNPLIKPLFVSFSQISVKYRTP